LLVLSTDLLWRETAKMHPSSTRATIECLVEPDPYAALFASVWLALACPHHGNTARN
jgi:hypothetical protein